MTNTTELPSSYDVSVDKSTTEIIATIPIKTVIKQHQAFVKLMPILSGITLLAALLLLGYLFHLKSDHLMVGFAFIAGVVLTLLLAGVGAVLLICFVSMGLGKFNQELWLISGINQFDSDNSDQQCKEKMLFLAEIYSMMGKTVFYLLIATIGLIAWCVKDGQQAVSNHVYATSFIVYIVLCTVVSVALLFKSRGVRKAIDELF